MPIENALASVAVNDLERATTWYEKLLEAPASHPMPEVVRDIRANGDDVDLEHFVRAHGYLISFKGKCAGSRAHVEKAKIISRRVSAP